MTACLVLDTNVVVSGLLSPFGPPGRLVDALLSRKLTIALDDRILLEYQEVLVRPKFQFDPRKIRSFLAIMVFQDHVRAFPINGMSTSAPSDTQFLEVAAASQGKILVTGNTKHYPVASRCGVMVLNPAEAWAGFVK